MKSKAILLASVLSIAVAGSAFAQPHDPKKGPPPKAAPAARPAPPPRPAAPPRIAAPPRPAPHIAAPPRPAPHIAAPPRSAPHIAAPPRPVPHAPPHIERAAPRIEHRPPRIEHAAPRNERSGPRVINVPQQGTRTPQVNSRAVQRQERLLRRQEERSLRSLPPAQRAVRRQEFERARQQRLNPSPALQAQPNAPARQAGTRHNGQPRIAVQAAQQGRFAAAFAGHQRTFVNVAPRTAWRRGLRAGFVPWYGPVFWPYAYADIFDYTFWPYAYDEGYWAYAYDDVLDGVFFGEAGPPPEYIEGVEHPRPPAASSSNVQQLCRQPGGGVTAWPFAELQSKLRLNEEQRALLADVRAAAEQAQNAFKESCPAQQAFALTPPGRLRAMTARLEAVLQAVETVRPPLTRFYDSLSDEQKERFNEIGPSKLTQNQETRAAQDTQSCKQPKPGLANLPIEQIEDAVNPTAAQEESLNRLQDATVKAVTLLQDACPDQVPLTPPGRLEAMQARLKAMIAASNAVGPALDDFYASLSSEQKARFNRMGRSLARNE
jgi:LTXXQ motif family protein